MILFKSAAPFFIDNKNNYPVLPNRYLDELADRSPLTVRAYTYALWDWFDWCEAQKTSWDEANEHHVRRYWQSLSGSNKTTNGHIDRVIAFYKWAADYHGFANPVSQFAADGMHRRPEHSLPDLVPLPQVGQFINTLPAAWHQWAAKLMLICGLRRAEAVSLPRSVLQLPKQGGNVLIPVIGKGSKRRIVKLPVPLRDGLLQFSDGNRQFVFEHDGRPYNPDTIGRAFKDHATLTSIAIYPHLLRHTYATYRLIDLEKEQAGKGGMNAALIILQYELGHASVETTSRYLHLVHANIVPESYSRFLRSMVAQTKVTL